MALLQEWRDYAYKFDDRTAEGQQFWLNYFNIEKGIYEQLLADNLSIAFYILVSRCSLSFLEIYLLTYKRPSL